MAVHHSMSTQCTSPPPLSASSTSACCSQPAGVRERRGNVPRGSELRAPCSPRHLDPAPRAAQTRCSREASRVSRGSEPQPPCLPHHLRPHAPPSSLPPAAPTRLPGPVPAVVGEDDDDDPTETRAHYKNGGAYLGQRWFICEHLGNARQVAE